MEKIKEIMGKIGAFLKKAWAKTVEFSKIAYKKTIEFSKIAYKETVKFCKNFIPWLKTVKWKIVWDHVTTGILILLMFSPFLILAYIFIWFLNK